MIRVDQLSDELERLAQHGSGCGNVEVTFGAGVCRCSLDAVDRIGCSVREIQILLTRRQSDLARLRKVADQLCRRLQYLVEPLCVVEIDPDAATVQARSSQPSPGPLGPVYYELLISPQGLRLVRYEAPAGQPRQQVSMHLTREVLVRLVRDLTDVAAGLA